MTIAAVAAPVEGGQSDEPIMPVDIKPSSPLAVVDPHHESLRNVDIVTFHRTGTAHLDITCCALVAKSANGIDWTNDALVTARLRMDVAMAKAFAEGLMKQVAMIEGSDSTMN